MGGVGVSPRGVGVKPPAIASVYIPTPIPRIYFSISHLVQFAFPDLLTLENKAKNGFDLTIHTTYKRYNNNSKNSRDRRDKILHKVLVYP